MAVNWKSKKRTLIKEDEKKAQKDFQSLKSVYILLKHQAEAADKQILEDIGRIRKLNEELILAAREREELQDKLQECVSTNLELEKSRDELANYLSDHLSLTFRIPKLIELFFKFGKEPHAIEKFWCQFGQLIAAQEQLDRKQNVKNCAVKVE